MCPYSSLLILCLHTPLVRSLCLLSGKFLVQLLTHSCPLNQLPGWLSGDEFACQCRRQRSDPWVGKIPWRKKWQPIPVF